MELSELCLRGRRYLASQDDYEGAEMVLLGVPMDQTCSFRPGARFGPQAIREVSDGLEEYSPYLERDLTSCAFYDAGDLDLPFGNREVCLERITAACSILLGDGKFPFLLGGEHLITLPLVQVLASRYPGLTVVHFDAHADLREEYLGEVYSHATVMRRICEIVGAESVFQFGIRSGTVEEFRFGREKTNFFPFDLRPGLDKCLNPLKGRPVYVTIDIDVIDPAYAPGTGTPEPGGVTPRELFQAIELLGRLQVVGCDLVELSPPCDPSGITSLLAAKLVREALLSFAGRKE